MLSHPSQTSSHKTLDPSLLKAKLFPRKETLMPKQTFALEAGGEKRLEVSWGGMFKNTTVSLDGNSIGVIPDQKALLAGQEFRLPDGSTIKVQLVRSFISTELRVFRNGQPLPGSASDPLTRLKN